MKNLILWLAAVLLLVILLGSLGVFGKEFQVILYAITSIIVMVFRIKKWISSAKTDEDYL